MNPVLLLTCYLCFIFPSPHTITYLRARHPEPVEGCCGGLFREQQKYSMKGAKGRNYCLIFINIRSINLLKTSRLGNILRKLVQTVFPTDFLPLREWRSPWPWPTL